jgi:hypothetical protein
MNISRRDFLRIIASAIATGTLVPAFAKQRAPYVLEGDVVDFVGRHPGGFIGGQLVHKVDDWDGVGYPVLCWTNGYGSGRTLERYYDFDLANFRREIPAQFWAMPGATKYPNVHTWLREQRFGETVSEAMEHLNFASFRPR